MMRRVRYPSRHHPCPRTLHVEESRVAFPPGFIFFTQNGESFATVFGISLDELQSSFLLRQRRRAHIDSKHGAEPQIFAHALMHHLLMDTSSARIVFLRPHRQVFIAKLAPHAYDF